MANSKYEWRTKLEKNRDMFSAIREKLAIELRKRGKITAAIRSTWTIRQYMNYAFMAVLNGYVINIPDRSKMYLEMIPIRELTVDEKKQGIWLRSNRNAEYMFRINITGRSLNDEFIYRPPLKIYNELKRRLDSDFVYKYLKTT